MQEADVAIRHLNDKVEIFYNRTFIIPKEKSDFQPKKWPKLAIKNFSKHFKRTT